MDILTINDRPGVYAQQCYYTTSADIPPQTSPLEGDVTCEVCVIGGGFTGLSAALELAKAGVDVVLLEANRFGWGASGRNGGQVHIGQRTDQETLEATYGKDAAHALWELGQEALALLHQNIEENGIDCDWQAGLIHTGFNAKETREEHAYADHLRADYGYNAIDKLDSSDLSEAVRATGYHGGIRWRDGGHLHPLKYALGLAKAAENAGARLFENARVTQVSEGTPNVIELGTRKVTAQKILVATNGYHNDLFAKAARYIMPINNYIATTEPLSAAQIADLIPGREAVADSNFVVNYYRITADNRMLFGGGETYRYRFPADIEAVVRPRMEQVFPQLRGVAFDHAWGGTLGITASRMPYFKQDGNVFTVGGFSGQGVCLTTLAGKLAAEALTGDASRFDHYTGLRQTAFPGGALLRWPLLAMAMSWYALRDRF